MQILFPLETYLSAELESERCKLIPAICAQTDAERKITDLWTILSFIPSRLERVQLVSSLNIPATPDGQWALCSFLLNDPEQDVVGNAINAMTRAQVRSFAHRAFHYFKSPERPQRILYCLARYCEEAQDRRIAGELAPTLASDLSDAYLARSFNALYKHGIKSEAALSVAFDLVKSHIDATNMDRKAAVSAITYLYFAGSRDYILGLRNIHDRVTIPELRRLLNWGFHEVSLLNFNSDESLSNLHPDSFWMKNFNCSDPNYSGFGCFSSSELVDGLKNLENRNQLPNPLILTERILRLGDLGCIQWLAEHNEYGLSSLGGTSVSRAICELWRSYSPQNIPIFTDSVLNPENAQLWHSTSPELFVLQLTEPQNLADVTFVEKWIQKTKSSEKTISLNVAVGFLLAIENMILNQGKDELSYTEIIDVITKHLEELKKQFNGNVNLFREYLVGALAGTTIENQKLHDLMTSTLDDISWCELTYAHTQTRNNNFIENLLKRFNAQGQNQSEENYDEHRLLTLVRTTALSILNCPKSFIVKNQSSLESFRKVTEILDPNSNIAPIGGETSDENTDSEESDQATTDWSGNTIVDRPIARWGAILGAVATSHEFSMNSAIEELSDIEKHLREAMRTANHVEKRWVVRALARISTDEAIKTLLYQGLQHIDSDFVALTIRELLPSPHPRAQQALIRCVGRNAIADELKLNILEDIAIHNPDEILQELKTLEILRLPQHIDDAVRDTVGRVAALMDETESLNSADAPGKVLRLDGQDVDSTIRKLLPNHEQLTIDARSALRTAEMILLQSRGWTQGGMDLSPIVNMHCKAVELVLRDSFEPFTDALLRKGHLSRKLDILGYARPIPEKMQVFEDALASLPIIRTIPYFSKFKLRKILRGVCLYRPGKRFTLDGPKAFALIFLVTARQTCSFGLEKMLELGFSTDIELYEYIKLIHSLQDSRNRAVHEGLTWEAKDEIESMRAQAFKVIEISLKLRKNLERVDSKRNELRGAGIGLGA